MAMRSNTVALCSAYQQNVNDNHMPAIGLSGNNQMSNTIRIPYWNEAKNCPGVNNPVVAFQPHVLSLSDDTAKGRRSIRRVLGLPNDTRITSNEAIIARGHAVMNTLKGCFVQRNKVADKCVGPSITA